MAANEIAEKGEGQVVEFDASIFEQDAMQEKQGEIVSAFSQSVESPRSHAG